MCQDTLTWCPSLVVQHTFRWETDINIPLGGPSLFVRCVGTFQYLSWFMHRWQYSHFPSPQGPFHTGTLNLTVLKIRVFNFKFPNFPKFLHFRYTLLRENHCYDRTLIRNICVQGAIVLNYPVWCFGVVMVQRTTHHVRKLVYAVLKVVLVMSEWMKWQGGVLLKWHIPWTAAPPSSNITNAPTSPLFSFRLFDSFFFERHFHSNHS